MTLLEFLLIIVITLLLVTTSYMSYCCEIAKRQVKYSNNYTKQMCKENRELKEHVLILEQKIDLTESNLKNLEDKILMNYARVFTEKQKQDENIEFWYPNFKNKNK